jgi:acyl dehydratase
MEAMVLVLSNYEQWQAVEGQKLGVSSYRQITQNQIDRFAQATGDHQWIHCDPERAAKESPFGQTIAHGYLTVSLISDMITEVFNTANTQMTVNYAIDNIRFAQPVVVDSRVRLNVTVAHVKKIKQMVKSVLNVTMEIEGNKKPAFTGKITFLYHYN